jgi:hypothetical protein
MMVSYPAISSPLTTIYVDPRTSTVIVAQVFTINIKISEVTDLYGWELKLKWNPMLLDALDVTEGNFLKNEGNTYFIKQINNTNGYLLAACTLIGDRPGVNGSGTLASVSFHTETEGTSALDLYDTKLGNSLEEPISHTVINGSVTISQSVGGVNLPVNKLTLLIPWIGTTLTLISAIMVAVVFAKHRKKEGKRSVSHKNVLWGTR